MRFVWANLRGCSHYQCRGSRRPLSLERESGADNSARGRSSGHMHSRRRLMSRIPLATIFALSLCSSMHPARSGPAIPPPQYTRQVVPFVDEAIKDPSLTDFRKALIDDAEALRTEHLLSIIPAELQDLRDLVGVAAAAKEAGAKSNYLRPLPAASSFWRVLYNNTRCPGWPARILCPFRVQRVSGSCAQRPA